jgi:streptogramin lyase
MPACAHRVASIEVHVDAPVLPLGQRTKVTVSTHASPGCPIADTYDHPIALSASHLSLSTTRLRVGRSARSAVVRWAPGDSGPSGTIVARSDGAIARATVAASSGFTYYDVGSNPQTDVTGSQIVAGPGGELFYGTIGPQTCSGGVCTSAQGAIGEFDPRSGTAQEIALPSEVLGLSFTSDGALWISGGASHLIYRMAPGPIATPAAILVPPPRSRRVKEWGAEYFAQDGGANVWFGDANGHRLLKIPLAGPYQESAIVAYEPPSGPVGTPRAMPYVGGLAYGRDGSLYFTDFNNGVLDRVDPASGATIAQILFPQQRALGAAGSVRPQFAATTNGAMALSLSGSATAPGSGAIDAYGFEKAIRVKTLPKIPAGSIPDELSFNGTYLYYADVFAFGIGIVDEKTGRSRLIPTQPLSDVERRVSPQGVAAMPDGTAWFTCQNSSPPPLQPLCIGHTVYLKRWSLFPGPSFDLDKGASLSQVVGIMESPARNSGPFRVRSSKPSICSVSKVVDHNFVAIGKTTGHCTVTVTDAAGRRASLHIFVI